MYGSHHYCNVNKAVTAIQLCHLRHIPPPPPRSSSFVQSRRIVAVVVVFPSAISASPLLASSSSVVVSTRSGNISSPPPRPFLTLPFAFTTTAVCCCCLLGDGKWGNCFRGGGRTTSMKRGKSSSRARNSARVNQCSSRNIRISTMNTS